MNRWILLWLGMALSFGGGLIYPIADVVLAVIMGIVVWKLKGDVFKSWEVWTLGALLVIGSAFSVMWVDGLTQVFRLVGVYVVVRYVLEVKEGNNLALWVGVMIGGLVQVGFVAYQLMSGELLGGRPYGISMNASALGFAGLGMAMTPLSWVGAVMAGSGMARTMVFGIGVWVVIKPSWARLMVFLVAILSMLAVGNILNINRFESETVNRDLDAREVLVDNALALDGFGMVPLGYRGYVAETGLQRPHNIFVLGFAELGILAFPVIAVLVIWVIRNRAWWVLPFVVIGMLTEEVVSSPSAFYVLGMVWLAERGNVSKVLESAVKTVALFVGRVYPSLVRSEVPGGKKRE